MQHSIRSPELKRRLRTLAYLSFAFAGLCSLAAFLTAYPAVHTALSPYGLCVPMMAADERLGVYALSGLFCFFGSLSWLGSYG
ncbi:MAG: hypothetical protein KDK78_11170 [Chlamydiia bacterium]|nr:hypothetical protein [Chlamydiia bacterium]